LHPPRQQARTENQRQHEKGGPPDFAPWMLHPGRGRRGNSVRCAALPPSVRFPQGITNIRHALTSFFFSSLSITARLGCNRVEQSPRRPISQRAHRSAVPRIRNEPRPTATGAMPRLSCMSIRSKALFRCFQSL
jgi:hypothetical protein